MGVAGTAPGRRWLAALDRGELCEPAVSKHLPQSVPDHLGCLHAFGTLLHHLLLHFRQFFQLFLFAAGQRHQMVILSRLKLQLILLFDFFVSADIYLRLFFHLVHFLPHFFFLFAHLLFEFLLQLLVSISLHL